MTVTGPGKTYTPRNTFFVTGAAQDRVFGGLEFRRLVAEDAHDRLYARAVLAEIDFDSKTILRRLVRSREEIGHAIRGYATNFTVPTLTSDKLHVPSHATLWTIDRKTLGVVGALSLPLMNDVHHALVRSDSTLVVSTGIDRVLRISDGGVPEVHECLTGCKPLDTAVDFRTVSTKPHESHPNHVCEFEGELWVTRARQKDVALLSNPARHVPLADVMVHDGIRHDGMHYFTAVDGQVITADLRTGKVVDRLRIARDGLERVAGWCRGLFVTDQHFFVGFSVLRKTKQAENIQWAKAQIVGGIPPMPTRIEKIDRATGKLVDQFTFDVEDMSAIFWLHPS